MDPASVSNHFPHCRPGPWCLLPCIALCPPVLTLWGLHHAVLCRGGMRREGEPASSPPPCYPASPTCPQTWNSRKECVPVSSRISLLE